MDPINPLISGHSNATQWIKEKEKKEETAKSSGFSRVFEKKSDSSSLEKSDVLPNLSTPGNLESWVDNIFRLGDELKKDPTLNSLSGYRKAVGHLLKHILSESYDLHRSKGVINPRTFKQKEFVNVEVINRKLDSLATYVLSSQKEQMEILRRVDEINGLIVDKIG